MESKKRPWNSSDDLRMARNCFLISFTIGVVLSLVHICTKSIVLASIMLPLCVAFEILLKIYDKNHKNNSDSSL